MKMLPIFLALLISSAVALADQPDEWNTENFQQNQLPKSKQNSSKQWPADTINKEDAAKALLDKTKSAFFPEWRPMSLSWGLRPILGLQFSSVTDERGQSERMTTEAGLTGFLKGIPVVPGNAGLYISPRAGKAWGSIDYKMSGVNKTESAKYNRTYGDIDFTLYAGFYRHVLGIMRGLKEYTVDTFEKIQTMTVSNDLGVLVLSWLSTHLSHKHLTGFIDTRSEPFLREQDYWLHARMFTPVLSARLDFGPGFTTSEEFSNTAGTRSQIADGRVQYLKALAGFHMFWKFSASAHAKYIYQATDKGLGNYAQITLPEQELNEPRQPPMPEDSLTASAFLGARNLIAGFGLGWRYNLQVLNWSERNGSEKITTKDQGFSFTYTANF